MYMDKDKLHTYAHFFPTQHVLFFMLHRSQLTVSDSFEVALSAHRCLSKNRDDLYLDQRAPAFSGGPS